MAVTDIATRTYDHGFRLDPIVRSLLDTDFYKLLMLQMIRHLYSDVRATFSLINSTKTVRLADTIDEIELRAQLDHARTVRFSKKELIWLAGNSFAGQERMFAPDFIAWLADFRLPEYELRAVDGEFELRFEGPWTHTTMWEIPALDGVQAAAIRSAPIINSRRLERSANVPPSGPRSTCGSSAASPAIASAPSAPVVSVIHQISTNCVIAVPIIDSA